MNLLWDISDLWFNNKCSVHLFSHGEAFCSLFVLRHISLTASLTVQIKRNYTNKYNVVVFFIKRENGYSYTNDTLNTKMAV